MKKTLIAFLILCGLGTAIGAGITLIQGVDASGNPKTVLVGSDGSIQTSSSGSIPSTVAVSNLTPPIPLSTVAVQLSPIVGDVYARQTVTQTPVPVIFSKTPQVQSLITDGTNTAAVTGVTSGTAIPANLNGLIGRFYSYFSSGNPFLPAPGTTGTLSVSTDSSVRTYTATGNITLAAAATDIVVATGSASTTIFIDDVQITGIATASGSTRMLLVKRSTNTTGGTPAAASVGPIDSSNSAASAGVTGFTANPTPGASVSTLDDWYQGFNIATASNSTEHHSKPELNDQRYTLRGISQAIALNLNGATVAGGVISYRFVFREYP